MIRDENGQLAGYVYVDTATRDIGGYVANGAGGGRRGLTLPAGLHAAVDRAVRVPGARARAAADPAARSSSFIIFVLLYMTFHSASEAVIVMLSVVYAMTGGVILQWLLGYNFSVAVWVGYIALYGVAVQTGVVMVVYLHEALDRRLRRGVLTEEDILEATIEGSVLRLRPKLMTVRGDHGASADHVGHRRRVGRDEADRGADHRRDDHVDDSRADHHAGHLLPHEAARPCAGAPSSPRRCRTWWRKKQGSRDSRCAGARDMNPTS